MGNSDCLSWDGNIHCRSIKSMPSLFLWEHTLLQAVEINQSESNNPSHQSNHTPLYRHTAITPSYCKTKPIKGNDILHLKQMTHLHIIEEGDGIYRMEHIQIERYKITLELL